MAALTDAGVLWSRYRRMSDPVADFEAGTASDVLTEVEQRGSARSFRSQRAIPESGE